ACKLHHVADCSVQRENASSQNVRTGSSALTVQHLDVETSQAIPAIGHTRGAQCISDKHRAFRTFGPKKQLDYGRIDVNAISNDVRTKTVISEDRGQNSRVAMVQWAHSVEGMCGVACTTPDSSLRGSHISVRMAEADANAVLGSLFDDLESAFQLRGNGHHLDVAAAALPKTLEELS